MKIRTLNDEGTLKPKDVTRKNDLPNYDNSQPTNRTLPIEVFQPWSNIIVKLKLPQPIFEEMLEVTDKLIADKNSVDFGADLVGQVSKELVINPDKMLVHSTFEFFRNSVGNYIDMSMQQCYGNEREKYQDFKKENTLIRFNSMWTVSQFPDEYNPIHIHTGCKVSSVMYIKVPKFKVDRKEHYKTDGKITFANNVGSDTKFANPTCSFTPEPGDMFIFASLQQHMVWPFRCDEEDKERRSVSFNADFTTETELNSSMDQWKQIIKQEEDMKKRGEGI